MLTQLVSSSTITVAMGNGVPVLSTIAMAASLLFSLFSLSRSLFVSCSVFLVWELGGTWGTREIVVLQSYLVWEQCLGILGTDIVNIGETAAALMRKSSSSPVLLCFGNFDWEL
jgi:hypothetical protein